jgi:hypothetical protein
MRRRTFFALVFAGLAVGFGALGALQFPDDQAAGYGYAVGGVVHLAIAGYYQVHPSPMDDPDASVPRRWVELTVVSVAALAVGIGAFLLVARAV